MTFSFTPRVLWAWALALLPALLAAGFFGDQHSGFPAVALVVFCTQLAGGVLFNDLLAKGGMLRQTRPTEFTIALLLFITLLIFVRGMWIMVLQFPSLFEPGVMLLEGGQAVPVVLGSALAFAALAWFMRTNVEGNGRLPAFIHSMSTGLLLAGFFFTAYFILASIFNRPAFDVDDIFFDTDGLLWRTRFVTDDYRDYYWRSVHPYVLLLIRPLIASLSILLNGDRLAAAFLLTALAGASCVFLTWVFVKRATGNSLHALLIASMLGASASHLVFGSLLETYIFLAAVTMIFMVMLLMEAPFLALLLPGLASFGITFTNFVQMVIAFVFAKRDLKRTFLYGGLVLALAVPLTLLNNVFYPDSQPYFFIPSTLGAEAENTFKASFPRAMAAGRVMLLHSIVAPDPLILQEEIPFLKVWIFKAEPMRLSEYRSAPGTILAIFWLGLVLSGVYFFLKGFDIRHDRFSLAFVLILFFNFVLHLRYGKDLFLYSTNWTYALLLFLALCWKQLAGVRWFQITLLLFIGALLANNSRLILVMLETSALHIK